MNIARTPKPPYYAVIFSNIRTEEDSGYDVMSDQMMELVQQQKGYLGHESIRDGLGITISYWDSLENIRRWKENKAHQIAQEKGRKVWYSAYKTRICKVERDYDFGMD